MVVDFFHVFLLIRETSLEQTGVNLVKIRYESDDKDFQRLVCNVCNT